jgi:hypothetical protein
MLPVEPPPLGGPRPIPPGSNLPAITRQPRQPRRAGWLALLVLIAIVIVAAIAGRQRVVQLYPPAAGYYAQIGLPVEPLGAGFDLRNVTSKRETDGDVTVLVISGEVANISRESKTVPLLQGTLHDAHDHVVQQWTFPAKQTQLDAGAVTSFETRLRNPPAEATGLTIGFVGS